MLDITNRWPARCRITGRRDNKPGFNINTLTIGSCPANKIFSIDGTVKVIVQVTTLGKIKKKMAQQYRFVSNRFKVALCLSLPG